MDAIDPRRSNRGSWSTDAILGFVLESLAADFVIVGRAGGLVDDVEVGMTRLTRFVERCTERSVRRRV